MIEYRLTTNSLNELKAHKQLLTYNGEIYRVSDGRCGAYLALVYTRIFSLRVSDPQGPVFGVR